MKIRPIMPHHHHTVSQTTAVTSQRQQMQELQKQQKEVPKELPKTGNEVKHEKKLSTQSDVSEFQMSWMLSIKDLTKKKDEEKEGQEREESASQEEQQEDGQKDQREIMAGSLEEVLDMGSFQEEELRELFSQAL